MRDELVTSPSYAAAHQAINLVPRAFSSFKMAVGETPETRWNDFVSFKQRFPIAENKQGGHTLETTSEKAISSCVTWQNTPRFLEYFSSLTLPYLTLARGFSDRHFERGEGPENEVAKLCTGDSSVCTGNLLEICPLPQSPLVFSRSFARFSFRSRSFALHYLNAQLEQATGKLVVSRRERNRWPELQHVVQVFKMASLGRFLVISLLQGFVLGDHQQNTLNVPQVLLPYAPRGSVHTNFTLKALQGCYLW